MRPQASRPVSANFPSEHLTVAAGVAIFHLATSRVVVCYHTRDKYWFLPKGRKNANEDILRAAEREGYEESGYRNRLLPLPMRHRQPEEEGREEFVVEPVWTQLMPVSARSQYILFWYVAETVTEEAERDSALQETYQAPVAFPRELTLIDRMKIDVTAGVVHEPVRHEGTGVDEEEALYAARLMSVAEACEKLRGSVMEDVVRRGWEAIQTRLSIEAARAGSR